MASLFAFFGSLAVSLPSRILAALGMGFVSYAGYAFVTNGLIDSAVLSWSGLPSDILSYFSLAGFPTGLGIILGCVVTRLSLTQLSNLAKIG